VKQSVASHLWCGAACCGSVFGTLAYLTSTDTVTNTFTVGKVQITLDEAPVDANGETTDGDRVKKNNYHLLPGHEYDKDPIVHFQPNSEASWLFVEVKNDISVIESTETGYKSIVTQITENGWTALDGVAGVYYKSVDANTGANAIDYPVCKSTHFKKEELRYDKENICNDDVPVPATGTDAHGSTGGGRVGGTHS